MAKKIKKRKKSILVKIVFAVFCVYVLFTFVNIQVKIGEKKKELADINAKITAQQEKNEQLSSVLNAEVDDEYVEKVAREIGYGDPNERIYEDISGK